MKVKLVPKTIKGKSRIREVGTDVWLVVRISNTVLFSDRDGPWYFVRPDSSADMRDHARWVHTTDDRDFDMEVLP